MNKNHPDAGADFRFARDHDPQPMWATAAMIEAMRAAARDTDSSLIDLEAISQACCQVPPENWFLDSLHFTSMGHAVVAEHLAPSVEAHLFEPLP